jgi:adenine phosphoribosyltransferase
MNLKKTIREIQDYPVEGINFKDITTLFKNNEAFNHVVNVIAENFANHKITKVVGMESRGFIVGGALAAKLNAGFVPIRKKGKLPAETISESYELEYGADCVEIHTDALAKDDVVLLHDDLLATGGTANAALNLIRKTGVEQIHLSFICDLEFIQTPHKSNLKKYNPHILVTY